MLFVYFLYGGVVIRIPVNIFILVFFFQDMGFLCSFNAGSCNNISMKILFISGPSDKTIRTVHVDDDADGQHPRR